MTDLDLKCLPAEERQRYFEQLCEMDERELRKLWENSEVRAKLEKVAKRLNPVPNTATPENTAYAISFFERHLKEDDLRYGERQAIHIALEVLREKQKEG